MLISVSPKFSASQVMGKLKGKTAIHVARVYGGRGGKALWDNRPRRAAAGFRLSVGTKRRCGATSGNKRAKPATGSTGADADLGG